MGDFRIEKSSKGATTVLIMLIVLSVMGGVLALMAGPVGLVMLLGGLLVGAVYFLILRGILEPKALVINDKGLKFYRSDELIQEIEWVDVNIVESFDQAKNDFVFHVRVKNGPFFIPDPYFFHADDMRKAHEKIKEVTNGMDIEFMVHDVRFA